MLSRKPIDVWSVRAVPTASGGADSVTIAENCAESETTKKPQTRTRGARIQGDSDWKQPTTSAQVPLTAMERLTTKGRPLRSASQPPQIEPRAPIPIAEKAKASAACGPSIPIVEAARKTGSQPHIAYSSHMWP